MAASTLLKGGAATLLSTTTATSLARTTTTATSLARTTTTGLIPRLRLPLFPSRFAAAAAFCSATDSAVVASVVESEPTTKEAVSADAVREAAGLLDIRIGRVMKAWRHPDAETLYVEEVDLGEVEFRVICSGLVNYVTLEELQDKLVVVLANLKPRNMRGVKSSGMLMAASDASHENVELLVPPESSVPGERIWFGLENEQENQSAAGTANQIQKKKIWELVQPHLKTDASGTAKLGEHVMRTSGGPVVSKSLKHANIS